MGFKNKAKRPSINSFSIELFYSFFFTTRCREIITNSNFAVKNKLDSVIYSGRRGSSGLVTTLLLETNHSEIGPNRAKTATGRPKTA